MLPGARIIDARRDALEAGWSCYKQQFYRLPHFACTLTDIAAYIRDYERVMNQWQDAEPERIRIQRYEALLAEPEQEIRALLAFCKLPFDARCLDFHRAPRSVRTASAAQVRQPLQRDTHARPTMAPASIPCVSVWACHRLLSDPETSGRTVCFPRGAWRSYLEVPLSTDR